MPEANDATDHASRISDWARERQREDDAKHGNDSTQAGANLGRLAAVHLFVDVVDRLVAGFADDPERQGSALGSAHHASNVHTLGGGVPISAKVVRVVPDHRARRFENVTKPKTRPAFKPIVACLLHPKLNSRNISGQREIDDHRSSLGHVHRMSPYAILQLKEIHTGPRRPIDQP